MNKMKKMTAVSLLAIALAVPSLAHASDMSPKQPDMNGSMSSDMNMDMKTDMNMDMKSDMTTGTMGKDMKSGMTMGSDDTEMWMMDGVSYVPLRLMAESLGYKVMWNMDDQSVTLSFMGTDMSDSSGSGGMHDPYINKVSLGSKEIMVGMDKKMLHAAPMLKNEKTYVPKDFITAYLVAPFAMK